MKGFKIPFTNLVIGSTNNGDSRSFLQGNGWDSLITNTTKSGVSVTKDNSLTISGVYASVRVITDAISVLPKFVQKEIGDTITKDTSHPLYFLIKSEPNSLMSSFVFWQIIMPSMLLWGNGYGLIEWENKGSFRPKAILPIHPSRVVVDLVNGVLIYTISIDGQKDLVVDQSNMLHFRGLGNEIMGKSVIDLARENLGLGKSAEEFGSSFFGNGANMNGVLSTDQVLNDKSRANIRDSWDKTNGGMSNAQKTAILEQGLKYQTISVPPDSAQFLETRRFSIEDIARWFKLPPHVIGDLERATFSNIEQQDLNFVKHSILPYVINLEQELNRKLLRESEKGIYSFEMDLEGLLRGDITTRVESYSKGIQNGWMTPNEARRKEGMNPIEGLDTTWMQTNTAPVVDGTNQPVSESEETIKIEEDEED